MKDLEKKRLVSRTYCILLCMRFLCVLLPGYVHPDEFFQSGQELFFGCPNTSNSHHIPDTATASDYDLVSYSYSYSTWGGKQQHAALVTTWEFRPENAIRSIVPPLFMTSFPLRIYVWLKQTVLLARGDVTSIDTSWHEDLSGFEILVVPRMFLALLSILAIDWPCQILTERFGSSRSSSKHQSGSSVPTTELLILSSSWPALVFFCRPFTNTLETIVLSVLLLIVSGDWVAKKNGMTDSNTRSLAVGILSSIGIFVRFTFAFFAIPAVAIYLLQKGGDTRRQDSKDNKNGTRPLSAAITALSQIVLHATLVSIGFIVCSCIFVAIDTQFYSNLSPPSAMQKDECATIGGRYIAPLNALLYNSKIDNLGEHGLHPRITHLAVNLPMLFGPLALFFYADIAKITVRLIRLCVKRVFGDESIANNEARVDTTFTSWIGTTICRLVIGCGLFILSCAPHQEPRFLLPTTVPLIALYGRHLFTTSSKRLMQPIWVLFNVLLLIFFGLLHQGGVVPSLLASRSIVSKSIGVGSTLFYHHTYMPPSFLSRSSRRGISTTFSRSCSANDQETCFAPTDAASDPVRELQIVDLKDSGVNALRAEVMRRLSCTQSTSRDAKNERVLVVAPASVWDASTIAGTEYEWHTLYTYQPHVTTEDMPAWRGNLIDYVHSMEISIYAIECRSH